ncbi:hypothetical protein POTOM_031563 [Populus tomentosa]|uniref:Uncharacterized protein n=1 Tax=Populus tomentosa TaxID=118781 RepID=A0A8X8CRU3_POPTO|nr:hypothetical protein POTOM_031563 [Populus tomentosa]
MLNYWAVLSCFVSFPDLFMFFFFCFVFKDYAYGIYVLSDFGISRLCKLGFRKNIYSPHLDTPPPRWVHFAHGLLLFLYQTFDAVDGKQARRTNSSSPLGELFDHGCDALACAFESMAFGSTAMCGRDTFWFWLISAVPFYCATWENSFLLRCRVVGPTVCDGFPILELVAICK